MEEIICKVFVSWADFICQDAFTLQMHTGFPY